MDLSEQKSLSGWVLLLSHPLTHFPILQHSYLSLMGQFRFVEGGSIQLILYFGLFTSIDHFCLSRFSWGSMCTIPIMIFLEHFDQHHNGYQSSRLYFLVGLFYFAIVIGIDIYIVVVTITIDITMAINVTTVTTTSMIMFIMTIR